MGVSEAIPVVLAERDAGDNHNVVVSWVSANTDPASKWINRTLAHILFGSKLDEIKLAN